MKSSILKIYIIIGLTLLLPILNLNSQDKKDIIKSETFIGANTGKFSLKNLKRQNTFKKQVLAGRKPVEKVIEKEVICPSCKKTVPILIVKSPKIALDTDFCEHYIGLSEYSFEIWSCSVCGYSHHLNFFTKEIPSSLKTLINKTLKPQMRKEIKSQFGNLFKKLKSVPLTQKIIPVHIKVLNMITYLENQVDIENQWKVFVYMRGIYALRNEISNAPSSTNLNTVFINIDSKLRKDTEIPQKESAQPHYPTYYLSYYLGLLPSLKSKSKETIALRILIAQSFNRLGYNSKSKEHLLIALEDSKLKKGFTGTIKYINKLIKIIDLEITLTKTTRDLMVSNFELTDKDIPNTLNASYMVYLIGEFSRRIDDYKNAYHWFSGAYQLFPRGDTVKGIKKHHTAKWIELFFKRKEFSTFTQSEMPIRHPAIVRITVMKIKRQIQATEKKLKLNK
ncbi:MAG: hypothetical protein COA79_00905 [Planctomycetota bacterium]|nr:MAG: hypothetical protein COA79_00905 [Planctomycetota bacterium]